MKSQPKQVKNPVQTLFGHSKPIVGVAISTELDMAVSASGDGVCNVYSVRKGVFIRTLSATNQSISTISTITLSPEGYIVFPAISHNQVALNLPKMYLELPGYFIECLISSFILAKW